MGGMNYFAFILVNWPQPLARRNSEFEAYTGGTTTLSAGALDFVILLW